MIQVYSVKKLGKGHKLSPHFTLGEFQCHDGFDVVHVSNELLDLLEEIRAWAREIIPGCTVNITSGYRTESHNAKIGGATNSQHLFGTAADFKVRKPDGSFVSPKTIYNALEAGAVTGSRFIGGLGLYSSWVHIDVRGSTARWKG